MMKATQLNSSQRSNYITNLTTTLSYNNTGESLTHTHNNIIIMKGMEWKEREERMTAKSRHRRRRRREGSET